MMVKKELSEAICESIWRTLSGLGIEPGKPFRCDNNNEAWYKITEECVPLWDAGTDQTEWFSDWVVLNHLLEGILQVSEEEHLSNYELKYEKLEFFCENCKTVTSVNLQPDEDRALCRNCGKYTVMYSNKSTRGSSDFDHDSIDEDDMDWLKCNDEESKLNNNTNYSIIKLDELQKRARAYEQIALAKVGFHGACDLIVEQKIRKAYDKIDKLIREMSGEDDDSFLEKKIRVIKFQMKTACNPNSEYMDGFYNGMEHCLSILEDRKPDYINLDKEADDN